MDTQTTGCASMNIDLVTSDVADVHVGHYVTGAQGAMANNLFTQTETAKRKLVVIVSESIWETVSTFVHI